MNVKKALVTGANGFVGSAVCRMLIKHKIEVIAVVRNPESSIKNIEGIDHIKIIYCDMQDYKSLYKKIYDDEIDIVYHFAWMGSAGNKRSDYSTQLRNIEYSLDLIKVVHNMGCNRIVFAASIMEYEVHDTIESNANVGLGIIYSTAKLSCDYMMYILCHNIGIEYIRCIISNIYGPLEESPRLINTSIRKILNNEKVAFSPGEQMYDFIYIDDAAEMFYLLGDNGKSGENYYIGTKHPKKLKYFLTELRDIVNKEAEIRVGEIPFDGVSINYAAIDLVSVERDTGYIPKVSFSDGIKKTVEWIRGITNGEF